MKCEYCYISSTDSRRKPPFKIVSADDFRRIANRLPVEKVAFHFCSIGDPVLYPHATQIWRDLSQTHAVIINANGLSEKYEKLFNCKTENLAIWFSIHWHELHRLGKYEEVCSRMIRLRDAGVTIWPMMVAHPSYMRNYDDIIEFAQKYDLSVKLMHCRDTNISFMEDGLVLPSEEAMKAMARAGFDFGHWHESFKRWNVRGSQCTSGVDFLVINSRWQMVSCGGRNINFGTFPDDIESAKFKEKGTCESAVCPCSWAIFHGITDRFERTMPEVLHSESGELKHFYGRESA